MKYANIIAIHLLSCFLAFKYLFFFCFSSFAYEFLNNIKEEELRLKVCILFVCHLYTIRLLSYIKRVYRLYAYIYLSLMCKIKMLYIYDDDTKI